MKKIVLSAVSLALAMTTTAPSVNALTLAQTLSGRIVLQVESKGEAWYVHPKELARYYLGRPSDAFSVMRTRGLGISSADLAKIPVSGTNDTAKDPSLVARLSGYIVLQVESKGEAWYIYPPSKKRYYLGRPDDAFNLMRNLGLGINNSNIATIPISPNSLRPDTSVSSTSTNTFSKGDGHDETRTQIASKLNDTRTSVGLPPLSISPQVTNAAQAQADDMATKGYYALTSPTGKKTSDWIKEAGYDIQAIAVHIDSFRGSASDSITRWQTKASSQYQETVLSTDYKELGIGASTVSGVPVYVITLTLSSADYFTEKTSGLTDIAKVRNDMLVAVNTERAKVGLNPLTMNDKLQSAAQNHTSDMLSRAYYDHVTPNGITPDQRVEMAGYQYQTTGENIAKGQTSVQQVMEGWMASEGHRENILNPNYTEVGFGLSFGKNTNGYEILWAQEFGKPLTNGTTSISKKR